MTECRLTQERGVHWLEIAGRIDSMSAPDIRKTIDDAVMGGARTLVADLRQVPYLSSAGLRVFIQAQKQLRAVSGELAVLGMTEPVAAVFGMGGLNSLFRIFSDRSELEQAFHVTAAAEKIVSKDIAGASFSCIERPASAGIFCTIGSQEKLPHAAFSFADVVRVSAGEVQYGTGLAAIGGDEESLQYAGEAVLLDRSLFTYPAVDRPAADYLLCADEAEVTYSFLHGFGFSGDFCRIVSFESRSGSVCVPDLVEGLLDLSGGRCIGIVLLAESRGLWGMNLKKVPTDDNTPANGKVIFDQENFSSWMNFPVEATDSQHIVAAAGIAAAQDAAGPEIRAVLPEDGRFHLHGAVFERRPLSRDIEAFEQELHRVLTGLEVQRVQHLLAKSSFSSGLAGIIDLEGFAIAK